MLYISKITDENEKEEHLEGSYAEMYYYILEHLGVGTITRF